MTSVQRKAAAPGVGSRNGGWTTEAAGWQLRPYHCPKPRPVSTLKLVELRNDDGHLVGWIPLSEAVAAALANIVEAAR